MHLIELFLHDMQEINTYRSGYVCLPLHKIQFENSYTDLDEIFYGRYILWYYLTP
jgi:hypothetical protein